MISKGFGKNKNIIAKGLGSFVFIGFVYREIVRFSVYLKQLILFDKTL